MLIEKSYSQGFILPAGDARCSHSSLSLLHITFFLPPLRLEVWYFSPSPPLTLCRTFLGGIIRRSSTGCYEIKKKDRTIWQLGPPIKLSLTPPFDFRFSGLDGRRRHSWRVQVHRIVPKRRRLALRELDRAPGEMCLSVSYAWIGTGPQEIQSSCHKPSEENALPKNKTKSGIEKTEEDLFVYLTLESAAEWATEKKKKDLNFHGRLCCHPACSEKLWATDARWRWILFLWKLKTAAGGMSREPLSTPSIDLQGPCPPILCLVGGRSYF